MLTTVLWYDTHSTNKLPYCQESVPDELTHCELLLTLDLGGNKIKTLPVALGRLTRLVPPLTLSWTLSSL